MIVDDSCSVFMSIYIKIEFRRILRCVFHFLKKSLDSNEMVFLMKGMK